jgi:hypothetical protein
LEETAVEFEIVFRSADILPAAAINPLIGHLANFGKLLIQINDVKKFSIRDCVKHSRLDQMHSGEGQKPFRRTRAKTLDLLALYPHLIESGEIMQGQGHRPALGQMPLPKVLEINILIDISVQNQEGQILLE